MYKDTLSKVARALQAVESVAASCAAAIVSGLAGDNANPTHPTGLCGSGVAEGDTDRGRAHQPVTGQYRVEWGWEERMDDDGEGEPRRFVEVRIETGRGHRIRVTVTESQGSPGITDVVAEVADDGSVFFGPGAVAAFEAEGIVTVVCDLTDWGQEPHTEEMQ